MAAVMGFLAAVDPHPCVSRTGGVESRRPSLCSSFVGAWRCRRSVSSLRRRRQGRSRRLVIVSELAGQYDETFEDVHSQLINYFTYKAARTVLYQLYEMNPTNYRWFYDFVASNKPSDGNRFLRTLGKEKQELAERVMITRLHLYAQWVKKCDHASMYQRISDENLQFDARKADGNCYLANG